MNKCLIVALAMLCGLTSCEKVTQLTKRFRKQPAPVAAPAAAAALVISDVSAGAYPHFISQPGKLVIIDFYADWCGPCRKLSPILEQLAAEHGGTVVVGKVNVDKARQLVAKERIQSIPDVRFFLNGRQVDGFVGVLPENEIQQRIKAHSKGLYAFERTPPKPAAEATDKPKEPENPEKPVEKGPAIRPMPKDWLPPSMERR
ncbi:MAG: hypothetical protein K9N23_14340 [Akkermansiaceae bacterium]|nr:hypothetical protein [Akkermansiaceae bacterium]